MSAYNYHHFPQDLEQAAFDAFRDHLRVGERAPDGEAVDLQTGRSTTLSSLWRAGPLILEFGSLS